MSLEPISATPIFVICLCACTIDHPGQSEICDYKNPVAIMELTRSVYLTSRIPVCEPCARAMNVPLLLEERTD